jgi:hypothetical protein
MFCLRATDFYFVADSIDLQYSSHWEIYWQWKLIFATKILTNKFSEGKIEPNVKVNWRRLRKIVWRVKRKLVKI